MKYLWLVLFVCSKLKIWHVAAIVHAAPWSDVLIQILTLKLSQPLWQKMGHDLEIPGGWSMIFVEG